MENRRNDVLVRDRNFLVRIQDSELNVPCGVDAMVVGVEIGKRYGLYREIRETRMEYKPKDEDDGHGADDD